MEAYESEFNEEKTAPFTDESFMPANVEKAVRSIY